MKLAIAPIRLAAPLGLLIGLAVASLAVASWRLPAGGRPLGADVTVTVQPSGELEVSPSGRIVTATGLKPSRPSGGGHGSFSVRNQTSTGLGLRVRALPSSRHLDGSLFLVVRASGRPLYRGPLRDLRAWSKRSFVLEPGASSGVEVLAWIPRPARERYRGRLVPLRALAAATPEGYAGRIVDIALEFRPNPVGG